MKIISFITELGNRNFKRGFCQSRKVSKNWSGGQLAVSVVAHEGGSRRKVHIAGLIPNTNGEWMTQMARNSTMAEWGLLNPGQQVLHDRDTKFCPAFQETVKAAGVTPIKFPPRSPNLNAHAERWVRSVKEKVLSWLILLGKARSDRCSKSMARIITMNAIIREEEMSY